MVQLKDGEEAFEESFCVTVRRYGFDISPIYFQSEEARKMVGDGSSFEIKDPVDPSKVVADVYLSKKGPYMNAQGQGNYMRPPTQDEIRRLRKIADETGVRLLNPQNISKYRKII